MRGTGKVNSAKKYRLVLSAVHMVYRLVNSTYNVKELSLRLVRLLCQFINAHSAWVFILDPEKKQVAMIAIFNNKINIFLDKKKDLQKIPAKEMRVTEGYPLIEKRMIGLPLVADEIVGAIFVKRSSRDVPFTDFDRELLAVFAEQSVTAIRNQQFNEQQQGTILSSIRFIGQLLQRKSHRTMKQTSAYFNVVKALAEKMRMSEQGIENLYYASILHDAGALDVPYDILSKRSQLTSGEFKVIRDMPTKSADLIRPVGFLKPVLPIILYHHEKYDGSGYPSGLVKEQIPLGARIMGVVDAFEAMISERPYRKQLNIPEAVEEVTHNSGTQFDPKVVKAFRELYKHKPFRKQLQQLRQNI